MRIQLPDVNVLVALHDATHVGHECAHEWFATEGQLGWVAMFSEEALRPTLNRKLDF